MFVSLLIKGILNRIPIYEQGEQMWGSLLNFTVHMGSCTNQSSISFMCDSSPVLLHVRVLPCLSESVPQFASG